MTHTYLHRLTFLLLVVVTLAAACSSKPKRSRTAFPKEPITARSPQAQAAYEDALATLEEGRWSEAQEKFRLLQAEYPRDPISVLAELYIARAGLGQLTVLKGETGTAQREALHILAGLQRDDSVDERVRYAAQIYHAAGLATAGATEEALLGLKDYPGSSMSPAILERDRETAWTLLAESLSRAARWQEAVYAYSDLFAAGRSEDDAEAAPLQELAKNRAFGVAAEQLSEAQLEELSGDETAFSRAVGGWEMLRRNLSATSGQRQREALQELHDRIAPDLLAIGEATRVAESSHLLAAYGPEKRYLIGAVLSLSGRTRTVGERALQGMLLAQNAYNARGEQKVTLVIADAAEGEEAAMQRFDQLGVAAVIGPLDIAHARALAPEANARKLPLFMLTTERPETSPDETYVFRYFLDAEAEARALAELSLEHNDDRRVAILAPDIGYGRRMATWFRTAFEAGGGTVVFDESYDRSRSDYAQIAARVARQGPDAIFIPDTAAKAAQVASFLAQNNVWGLEAGKRASPKSRRTLVHYLGTSLWQDGELTRQAGSYVNGALIPAWTSPAFDNEVTRTFYGQFQETFARPPDYVEAFAYDAVSLVRMMMVDRGIADREALRLALFEPRAYRGVTGPIRFRPNGDAVRVLRFITVADDAFQPTSESVVVGDRPAAGASEKPRLP